MTQGNAYVEERKGRERARKERTEKREETAKRLSSLLTFFSEKYKAGCIC